MADSKTLSEERAQKAAEWVEKEVYKLLGEIEALGAKQGKSNNGATLTVTFGVLFERYADVSDTLVGILARAKKRGLLQYEGQGGHLLFQGKHDHVVITLDVAKTAVWRKEYASKPTAAAAPAASHVKKDLTVREQYEQEKKAKALEPGVVAVKQAAPPVTTKSLPPARVSAPKPATAAVSSSLGTAAAKPAISSSLGAPTAKPAAAAASTAGAAAVKPAMGTTPRVALKPVSATPRPVSAPALTSKPLATTPQPALHATRLIAAATTTINKSNNNITTTAKRPTSTAAAAAPVRLQPVQQQATNNTSARTMQSAAARPNVVLNPSSVVSNKGPAPTLRPTPAPVKNAAQTSRIMALLS